MHPIKIGNKITNREGVSLEKFLHDISREQLLTPEQEAALGKRIQMAANKGSVDQEAIDQLVVANLRFVVSVAKQYQGLPIEDLIAYGIKGLLKAATLFDYTRGLKFISYAVWWTRQGILQALSEYSRTVRLPLNRVGSLRDIHHVTAMLSQRNQRFPTDEEIAEELNISPQEVRSTIAISARHTSLQAPFAKGEEHAPIDVLEDHSEEKPDTRLDTESLEKDISKMTASCLNNKELQVICRYFGIKNDKVHNTEKRQRNKQRVTKSAGMNLQEISDVLGLTRERVRQIKERALAKLRKHPDAKKLKLYLSK